MLALEAASAAANEALASTREELTQARKRLDTVESERTCSICFEGADDGTAVNTALTPCGHCYCEECAKLIVGDRCPTCKQPARGSLKVFR